MAGRPAAALVASLGLAVAHAGPATAGHVFPRPTTGTGRSAYTVPEAPPLVGRHAVVHYVTSGRLAPPRTDADDDGVPDFVELVSLAADHSIDFFAEHGFLPPAGDRGGPNALPDIYIGNPGKADWGVAFAPSQSTDGPYVVLAPDVDPIPGDVDGSLYRLVAHELFHLVQFSYTPKTPRWVAEGQAAAVAELVYPQITDWSTDWFVEEWLRHTGSSLYASADDCRHCYGDAIWWLALERLDPRIMPAYLGRLYGYRRLGRPLGVAAQPLQETLARLGHDSLFAVFTRFSLDLYRSGRKARPSYTLTATAEDARQTKTLPLYGLSARYVRFRVPRGAHAIAVDVETAGGPRPAVTLILGGPHGRALAKPLAWRRGRLLMFRARLRDARERSSIVLVLASGRQDGVWYRLTYRSG